MFQELILLFYYTLQLLSDFILCWHTFKALFAKPMGWKVLVWVWTPPPPSPHQAPFLFSVIQFILQTLYALSHLTASK